MNNIAIFASGSGTNAENIINHFKNCSEISVSCILSNVKDAFVLKRAQKHNIKTFVFNREDFYYSEKVVDYLNQNHTTHIVLAGFLWLIPENIIRTYQGRIVNIHPALLPKYGGKGMYGRFVHQAVIENKEKESGITIHHVNPEYDEGNIIFQARCSVDANDTPESLAQKVHELEYKYFPEVIEKLILGS